MENRNPYVLNDHVQWYPTCTTSQQPAAPVNARHQMTPSTQPPEMAHLYPAAAQPSYRGDANCKPEYYDCGLLVPIGSRKMKRIVYSQHTSPNDPESQEYKGNILSFTGRIDLIDYLRKKINRVYEMEPDYADSDASDTPQAHPLWAREQIFTETDNTVPCQTPRECQTRSYANLKKPSMNEHA